MGEVIFYDKKIAQKIIDKGFKYRTRDAKVNEKTITLYVFSDNEKLRKELSSNYSYYDKKFYISNLLKF